MKLTEKDFKVTMINILNRKHEQNGWKDGEFLRKLESIKNQVHILEVKNIVPEIKNSLDGFNSRLYIQERTETNNS